MASTATAMIVRTGMVNIDFVPSARKSRGMSDALIRSLPAHDRTMPR